MARKPRSDPETEQEAVISPLSAQYSSFDPARVGTGTSLVVLSNNNLTATVGPGASVISTAATTPGDNASVYFEVTFPNFPGGSGPTFGLVNTAYVVNGNQPPATVNSIGISQYGSIYINNVQVNPAAGPGPPFAAGDWLGVAVNFPNKTIQWRNITQNSAWSAAYSFAPVTPTPFFFGVGFNTASTPLQAATVNFDGTFLGTPPSGGYARWHTAPTSPMTGPKDTFSEQPATVITVDALIANGSYTASGPTDRVNLPFSVVQFGAATIDTNNNLQFQDVVIDDPPLLAITLQVAGPATVTIYGQWDYSGTWFVITTVNIPTSTAVTVTNIPILPPNYPQWGQGDILQLSLTCSTTALFTWSNGHVYGIETVPIYPTVEGAPVPPSILGRAYTLQTGGTNIVYALQNSGSSSVANTVQHVTVTAAGGGLPSGITINGNGDLVFTGISGTGGILTVGANIQQSTLPAGTSDYVTLVYSWDGGPYHPVARMLVSDQFVHWLTGTIPIVSGNILTLGIICSSTATLNWSNGNILLQQLTAISAFPAAFALVPPPQIGQGGGAPPTFPPPTPPPIGAIPVGILVGPAIAAAAVPPSTAGIPLIIYAYGSATAPPASAAFPEFTTIFPSPPIVFSNIFTDGVSPTTPPSTATTPPLGITYNTGGVWGPPIGPALPVVVPPVRPFMVATNGNPDDVVEVQTAAGSEPNSNGEVYDDSDEEEADWVEETPHRTPPTKPRGRGRRK